MHRARVQGQHDEPYDDRLRRYHERPNKGMKLTRVGAGARRTGRSEARCRIAAQLMPGVRRTAAGASGDGLAR